MAAAVAAEEVKGNGGVLTGNGPNEIDGFKLPEGITKDRVLPLLDLLSAISEEGRKAQTTIDKKRASIADEMLTVARQCANESEWTTAYFLSTIRYKAKHGTRAMPKVYTQTASDIKRMYAQRVNLNTKDEHGNLLSYSKLKTSASKAQRVMQAKVREANEKSKPEYLKTFEGMVSLVRSFAVNRQTETYFTECKIFDEINEILRAKAEEWVAEHPAPIFKDDEEPEHAPDEQQPEPARATG